MGAPSTWATWEDEGLNYNLKLVANRAYRAVWHKRVLVDFNLLTERKLVETNRKRDRA